LLAAFSIAALLLTSNPAFGAIYQPRLTKPAVSHQAVSNRPGAISQEQAIIIRAKCCAYALKYKTKPAYVMSVAHIESRKGSREFRVGRVRCYWLPMGIHNGFLKERGWPVDTLDGNIEAGARALSGIQDEDALKRRLKKYNCEFNGAYWHEICQAIIKYKKGVSL
jgi:hypothetical protein